MKFDRLAGVTVPPHVGLCLDGNRSSVHGHVGPADWVSSWPNLIDLTSDS